MKFKKVYIEITNICNRNCSFCIKSNRKKEEMSLEFFEKVIIQVSKYTNYVYLHIKGEPLLHSNFREIINICKKYNMFVNITTNAVLLSKYKDILINSSVRQINVSTHSFSDCENLDELLETVDYINSNSSIYLVYRYWILNENNNGDGIKCLEKIKNHYNLNSSFSNTLNYKVNDTLYINKDFEFVWPSLSNSLNNCSGFCLGLKSHFGILSDGTVVPCCLDGEGIINLGNLHNESLDNILNSNRVLAIKNGFKNNQRVEELCKHCSFK